MSPNSQQTNERTSLLPPPVQSNPREVVTRRDEDSKSPEEKPTLSTPKSIALALCIATLIFLQSAHLITQASCYYYETNQSQLPTSLC